MKGEKMRYRKKKEKERYAVDTSGIVKGESRIKKEKKRKENRKGQERK